MLTSDDHWGQKVNLCHSPAIVQDRLEVGEIFVGFIKLISLSIRRNIPIFCLPMNIEFILVFANSALSELMQKVLNYQGRGQIWRKLGDNKCMYRLSSWLYPDQILVCVSDILCKLHCIDLVRYSPCPRVL